MSGSADFSSVAKTNEEAFGSARKRAVGADAKTIQPARRDAIGSRQVLEMLIAKTRMESEQTAGTLIVGDRALLAGAMTSIKLTT